MRDHLLPTAGKGSELRDQRLLREQEELGLAVRLQKGPPRVDLDLSPGPLVLWPREEVADSSLWMTLTFPPWVKFHLFYFFPPYKTDLKQEPQLVVLWGDFV